MQAGFFIVMKKRMHCHQSHTHQPPSGILMMLLDRKRPSSGTAAGAAAGEGGTRAGDEHKHLLALSAMFCTSHEQTS